MEQRRVLIAVLLSLVVLIGWQMLFKPAPPVPPQPETEGRAATDTARREAAAARAEPQAPDGTAGEGAAVAASGSEGEPATGARGEDTAAEPPAAPTPDVAAEREERVVVETDLYRAELTNRGAQIVSFQLGDHRSRDGGPVDLVRMREEGAPYPFAVVDSAGQPTALDEALFAVERHELDSAGGRATEVVFTYSGKAGRAEKRFLFRTQGLFNAEVTVTAPEDWALMIGPGVRNPAAAELENRFERRSASYLVGDELERRDPRKAEGPLTVPAAGLKWVALEDNYFLTAMMPEEGVAAAELLPYLMTQEDESGPWLLEPLPAELTDEQEEQERDYSLLLLPRVDTVELVAYWGAKKYDRLDAMDYGLEKTVNLGIFGFFARWILKGLLWIHDHVVHNYGWAIVLMTLLIKLGFFPLTQKLYSSQLKMKEINPRMQAIRAKWRGKLRDKNGKMNFDAQRQMNEEIRKLYADEGVNPAGGCVPMLIQLPILFAFYSLLTAAVELRGAPWLGWVHDLSSPDPYYALPIIMGATQFVQQRMTPMTGDPMQRRIMQLIPFVWLIFFLGFPSGLVLYWLTNNVLTITQQWAYNRFQQTKQAASGGSSEKPAPKKKLSKRMSSK